MEMVHEEKQELEYKNANEDQGGIRQRLRDRDLLRKRRAEAEEKETNQEEIQRKRPRVQRSGTKRRGRPRKTEPTPAISAIQQEPAAPQEAYLAVGVSESLEVIPDPASDSPSSLPAVKSQPASVLTAPAPLPVFESVQSPIFDSTLTPLAPLNPTSDLFSTSGSAPDTALVPVQDLVPALAKPPDAVPVPTLTQVPVLVASAAPPAAPGQVGALYEESEGRVAPNQVIIEDLGPDGEEELALSQDKRADEDLSGTPLTNKPEQRMSSASNLSTLSPPQEFLPGN